MKKMKLYKVLIFVLLVTFLFNCNKGKDIVTVDLGYDYYPLNIGNEWVYDVQLISLTILGDDTLNYQLKEVVVEKVEGGDEANYLLYRYKRFSDTTIWKIDSVWSVKKEERYLVKTENNVRYQKLAFGVSSGLTWDGNIWNIFEERIYTIVSLGAAYLLGEDEYTDVLEVEQKNETNLILSIDNRELYARGVGLIEIYKEDLETQPLEKTLGNVYHQVLISSTLMQ